MRIRQIAISTTLLLGLTQSSRADTEMPPETYMVTSNAGRTLLVVTVSAGASAFHLEDDGTLTKLWTTSASLRGQLFLSDDGVYLAEVNASPRSEPSHRHQRALAFYRNGEHLEAYLVEELVKDRTRIGCTYGHFHWVAAVANLPTWRGDQFVLIAADGMAYTFKMGTSPIQVTTNQVPKEKLPEDLRISPSLGSMTGRGRCYKASDWVDVTPPLFK